MEPRTRPGWAGALGSARVARQSLCTRHFRLFVSLIRVAGTTLGLPGEGLFHRLGIVGNNLEQGAGGSIGHEALLFPVAHRAEGQLKRRCKFLLGEPELFSDCLEVWYPLQTL